ncbi:hypothetical protein [Hahella sp. CCB-MM4]|uniref:hypothetical protein n=1 Tax=Hahella sp. (strain CCB-MM4) TaxID=1926491 RepID=UPI00114018A7|nr:hypothetical protein [Hahella sp. CCB-MM4]
MKTNLLAAILAVIVVVLQLFLMQQRSTEHKAQESGSHITQNSVSMLGTHEIGSNSLENYDFQVSFLTSRVQPDWSRY